MAMILFSVPFWGVMPAPLQPSGVNMGFICRKCQKRKHEECQGKNWCDCQCRGLEK